MKNLIYLILAVLVFGCQNEPQSKPNFVWIMLEDWGYQLSCYDEPGIHTPHIDQLASEGVRFTNSFCTAPVCSPSRSAMITGFHQNYIGVNQHRTIGPGWEKKELPYGIKPFTHLLEEAGYFTCFMATRKTDYNFIPDRPVYQGKDWSEREEGQPFYAQLTFPGTHRIWKRDTINPIDIEEVRLPPYYPDVDFARRDWANGLEAAQIVDRKVGGILDRLDEEGLSENTMVILIGDNGRCMPRGKQFLYDGGIQVPIIVRWPGHIEEGRVNDNMVMTIDITKTILDAAGIDPGYDLHGQNLFGREVKKREYIFAARDKMDDTYDAMRVIRSDKYKLIHNLMPERAWCQYNKYKEQSYPVWSLLNILNIKGELPPEQAAFMAKSKPEFELFDMVNDPDELHNLSGREEYQDIEKELLSELNKWRKRINDQGVSEDFMNGGWPADYPTKTLEEWDARYEEWKPWVFREPGSKMKHPRRNWKD